MESFRKALLELESMGKTEKNPDHATYNSKPFVTAAEGVYKSFVDLTSISNVLGLVLSELAPHHHDSCFLVAKNLLADSFREKLRSARNNPLFVPFIRFYFDVAIKRWR
jgi:hypothetical protein